MISKHVIKVLINLAPLKAGGGQNVAFNFLQTIIQKDYPGVEFHFVVSENSAIHEFLQDFNVGEIIVAPSHPVKRVLWEVTKGSLLINSFGFDVIYSYFGFALYICSIPQVVGSADSNIYCPEIDFWKGSPIYKLKKKVVDAYRMWGVKSATAVIFENSFLKRRGERLMGLKETAYIMPSINVDFESLPYVFPDKIKTSPKGLFLCGWQENKNYKIIPFLAKKLKYQGVDFQFLLTAPANGCVEHLEFIKLVKECEVDDMVAVLGRVDKKQLESLYSQVDCVFLLSLLESFSNNIIEAWAYSKVLIVSDLEWARSICQNAAVYVDRNDADEICKTISKLISDKAYTNSILMNGRELLREYPTCSERTSNEIDYLKYIYETY